MRAAAAGTVAAVVWGLQEPLDQRVFGCEYSDVLFLGRGRRSLGFVVHAANGALFGLAFDAARRRVTVDQRRLALGLALAEHLATWPLIGLSTAGSSPAGGRSRRQRTATPCSA